MDNEFRIDFIKIFFKIGMYIKILLWNDRKIGSFYWDINDIKFIILD